MPRNVQEAALIERIKAAVREDLSRSSLMTVELGHNGGPPFDPEPPVYDIPEFCRAHRLSRSTLYDLWQQGLGPRVSESTQASGSAARRLLHGVASARLQRISGSVKRARPRNPCGYRKR